MGPYCQHCNQRCFTPIPKDTPEYLLKLYREYRKHISIIATCEKGQAEEKKSIGTCYDDIVEAIKSFNSVKYITGE